MSMKLNEIFKDNMTLPADVPFKVWGEAEFPVTVSVDLHHAVDFSRDGKFVLTVPAHKAGGPYTMFIESEGVVTKLEGVKFGDVDPNPFI